MKKHYPLLIAKAGPSDACLEVTAPYDGAPIATLDTANGDAVDRALSTAYGLFRDRSCWLDIEKRVDILRRAAGIMREQAERLALEAAREAFGLLAYDACGPPENADALLDVQPTRAIPKQAVGG